MKKLYFALAIALTTQAAVAQNPGLVISEFMANPDGADGNKEWIELVATQAINFSATPYTVVVSNNGTATASGWIQGGTVTYAFQISSGSVAQGDVVYVGGTEMAVTGVKIYQKAVATTAGDGFGTAANGVIGNGGANADGIAVFNLPAASLTSSSVPVDAILFGTSVGSAFVSASTGYQLPVNDTYSGGKVQLNSYFAGDPGANITIKATGAYNIATNTWGVNRSWTSQSFTDNSLSNVSLVTVNPPGTATIATNNQIVNESAGTATVNVSFSNANNSPAKIAFGLSSWTNATQNADFSWASDTLTIPANTTGTFPFTITINDDALAERTERIIVKMTGAVNAAIAAANYQIIYLKDNDYSAPAPSNELQMQLLSSFSTGASGTNSAEIVAFDPTTDRLYTANSIGGKIDILDFSNPSQPSVISSVSMAPYGGINSLVVHNGVVAAAVENSNPQADGSVVFFDSNGTFISQVTVGAMPDMITFNNDFTKVLVACEGEPNTNYTPDPEGEVAIINLSAGYASLTNANVTRVNFHAFNGQEAALRSQGIRIFGPGSTAAQDFEPEYITVSEDNTTAYVTLQENNAMAVVNIASGTVTAIRPLGLMDYSSGNGMDASDQSGEILISSVPVKGAFMPDAMAHATIGGTEYLFTANEGDAREYAAVSDIARISATSLDPTAFPDQAILKNNTFLGRLNALQMTGDTDGDGDKDEIHVLGTRSFSIWNAQTGALVFDSKDLLEQITASHPTLAGLFNASNSSGTSVKKNRSDDKGPEPEGVATAVINNRHYLFVSLERIGGVMIFNVENPLAPVYSGYYNNRSIGTNSGPDLGAEGIIHIKPEDSPNGKNIVILANEVSSTLSIYQVNTCVALAGGEITATEDSICAGETTVLAIQGNANTSVQWFRNNSPLSGETGTTLTASLGGEYRVYVSNPTFACSDTSVTQTIVVHSLPVVVAGADQSVCTGTSVTLFGAGAQDYTWNNPVVDSVAFVPAETSVYVVTGTDVNGCQDIDSVTVTVNALPVVFAGNDRTVCAGEQVTLAASGAVSYNWNNAVTDSTAFIPAATSSYVVTGTDANGCEDSDTLTVTVNSLPEVYAGMDMAVCAGGEIALWGFGAVSYEWNNGIADGEAFVPLADGEYIVSGVDSNNCTSSDTVLVTVNELPLVDLGADRIVCQYNFPVALTADSGFESYLWNTGDTTMQVSVAAEGTYSVTVSDENGCEGTDSVVVTADECLGIDELEASLEVYPNPASDHITVKTTNGEALKVILRTVSGQEIATATGTGEIQLNLANLAAGTYFIHVFNGSTQRQFAVLKQ